jgi:hypothetical protein
MGFLACNFGEIRAVSIHNIEVIIEGCNAGPKRKYGQQCNSDEAEANMQFVFMWYFHQLIHGLALIYIQARVKSNYPQTYSFV